ncbi:hypothetical protein RvY_17612-1 [Ramazzottius varieornatus]|uniref:Uncharacterized protein n=1 Tax=Ramazzottius varieornatus TaxID=947166 RepID=A0A1D1W2R3_RAMVA|nr:hypothetical protein RvY_17612-1 [Ramazzottius varieornatus]
MGWPSEDEEGEVSDDEEIKTEPLFVPENHERQSPEKNRTSLGNYDMFASTSLVSEAPDEFQLQLQAYSIALDQLAAGCHLCKKIGHLSTECPLNATPVGENGEASSGRHYGSGRPIDGIPMEENGKWKLRVVGLGNDGAVKTEDLKAAFVAKGATVIDCFVPEGKHFGFVSFSSQEEAEKYGAEMNGSKPSPSGRCLKIDWALPRNGGGTSRTCYKCKQSGHMANTCPGTSANATGSAIAESAGNEGAAGIDGSAAAASNGTDWGFVPAAAAPVSSGNSGRERGGQGGKALTGTPTEDRGKWKLRVVGFGDDGSVNADSLKAVFEEKGATVVDAYVPDGKPFGFISFTTQEDAEKYGTMMNGSKPFPNGRYMNIQWALPKAGGGGGGGGGGGRNCYKCQQPGHIANSCPGVHTNTASNDSSTDSWGAAVSEPSTTSESTGGGWGDASAATTEPAVATGGGWGDAGTTTTEAGDNGGGGWGDTSGGGGGGDWGAVSSAPSTAAPSNAGRDRDGQGGKPITGTPLEDRGKWKLRVVGFGDEGSVKAEDLKAAFEAKGATVADVFVAKGKHFGFISFNTQADAEKYGAIMNGSKPFLNGRFLKVEWALPKGGAGGGGRNCFKCQQHGHMANNCPGVSTSTTSTENVTDSWGGVSASSSGGGWGDGATASSEPAAAFDGGWGDSATTSSDAGSTAGLWGDGFSTNNDAAGTSGGGWGDAGSTPSAPADAGRSNNFGGQGGKPLGGTPVEDRGKWKLKVTGLGDDGTVKSDDLKAAFEAKGATVPDAFVPEGRHFGFVSFSSQEEGEKFGTMMNGTKPFPNGRFLRIEWAQPRNAAGGGPRNSNSYPPPSIQVSAPTSDSWGGGGDSGAPTSGNGGWGDAAVMADGETTTKTDEGSSGGSGWGDAAGGGCSDWGAGSNASFTPASSGAGRDRGGQGGKPLTGTPNEDRGKWKLRVVGFGDDGSVNADSLKAVFEEKGATVVDAYVPQGKPFGFVSFGSQEDAEKYGTMMNGSKPFPNGRYMNIQWALPKAGGGCGGGSGGGRNCFKCQQPGHMTNNCPGVSTSAACTGGSTDTWGGTSASSSTDGAAGGGWGDGAPASSEPAAASDGGWVGSDAGATSGIWGDGSSTNNDAAGSAGSGWGDSGSSPSVPPNTERSKNFGAEGGKPPGGTPTEDRGKWKLKVTGLGDDGAVTSDDLKAAFEAKGATVPDAFVPVGKHFGFVSFNSQEEGEKYGTMVNGTKPFPKGRFLRIEWAQPRTAAGGGGGGGGSGRNCFKCHQSGHMANSCPGVHTNTASNDSSTDSWGAAVSEPSTTSESTGGGWGDASAATTEPAVATGGGWGDAGTTTTEAGDNGGGGWGDTSGGGGGGDWGAVSSAPSTAAPSNAGRDRDGQGGKPITGTPLEDRGKWKLRVVGFGDEGSVKAEDLKAAFEAKGATVADVFVAKGKHFGFISFNTQADAEKYGAIMNGSKPFLNGRFLKVEWALPKGGAGGGGRNCFKCQQHGHMANNCPGVSTSTTSTGGTTDSWGGTCRSTDGAAGGGWGDAGATSSEPTVASGGGWGDSTTTSSDAGSTGGIWGDGSSTANDPAASSGSGWGDTGSTPSAPPNSGRSHNFDGQGGKPPGGTPVEDRGKWKLRITGLGDDGTVKSDDLKAAFEAKGATVSNAFVPEGKHFGFASFNSMEEGEKYGTMLNGTKPFPNGRFLRIEWAQPRNASGGGGPRNSNPPTSDSWGNGGDSGATASGDGWGDATIATKADEATNAGSGWGDIAGDGGSGWGDAGSSGGGWGDSGSKTTADGVFKVPQDPPARPAQDPKLAFAEYQKSLAQRQAEAELAETKRKAEEARADMEEARAERERYYEMAQRQKREAQKAVRPPPRRKSELMGSSLSPSLNVDWVRQAIDRTTNAMLKELNNLEAVPREHAADLSLSGDLRAKLREDTDNLYPAARSSARSPAKRDAEDSPSPKRIKKNSTPVSQKVQPAVHELFGLPAVPATPPPTPASSPATPTDVPLGRTRQTTRKLRGPSVTPTASTSQPSSESSQLTPKTKKRVSFNLENEIVSFEVDGPEEQAPAPEPSGIPEAPRTRKSPGLLDYLFSEPAEKTPSSGSSSKRAKRS